MGNIEFKEVDHSIFDLLNWVRKKPQFFLDGDLSLRRLRSLVVGYQCGLGRVHCCMRDHELFDSFHDWTARKLSFSESTSGWCSMILARSENDEKAYYRFFELLDEFRMENDRT